MEHLAAGAKDSPDGEEGEQENLLEKKKKSLLEQRDNEQNTPLLLAVQVWMSPPWHVDCPLLGWQQRRTETVHR